MQLLICNCFLKKFYLELRDIGRVREVEDLLRDIHIVSLGLSWELFFIRKILNNTSHILLTVQSGYFKSWDIKTFDLTLRTWVRPDTPQLSLDRIMLPKQECRSSFFHQRFCEQEVNIELRYDAFKAVLSPQYSGNSVLNSIFSEGPERKRLHVSNILQIN